MNEARRHTRLRWPRNADAFRQRAYDNATDARELLDEAIAVLTANPYLAQAKISDARALLSDIQRDLSEAKFGVDPE